jgi:hypothetical protein
MSDEPIGAEESGRAIFPDWAIPTYFIDGVGNFQPGSEVGRFYLVRSDPAANAVGLSALRPVAQVVLTNSAFVNTAIFFESVLRGLVADGHVTEEHIADVRAQFAGRPDDV